MTSDYETWLHFAAPGPAELAARRSNGPAAATPGSSPSVSLLMATDRADEIWIRRTIDSLLRQTSDSWELLAGLGEGSRDHAWPTLRSLAARDGRIRLAETGGQLSRVLTLIEGVRAARGRMLMLIEPGMELDELCLERMLEVVAGSGLDLAYGDEDRATVGGQRIDPCFKPPWSPERFMLEPYLGSPLMLRRELAGDGSLLAGAPEGLELESLVRRIGPQQLRGAHVPGVAATRRDGSGGSRVRPESWPDDSGGERVHHAGDRYRRLGLVVLGGGRATDLAIERIEASVPLPLHSVGAISPASDAHPRTLEGALEQTDAEILLFIDASATLSPADPNGTGEEVLREACSIAAAPGVGTVFGRTLDAEGLGLLAGPWPEPDPDLTTEPMRLPRHNDAMHHVSFPAARSSAWLAARSQLIGIAPQTPRPLGRATATHISLALGERGLRNVYLPELTAVENSAGPTADPETTMRIWGRWSPQLRLMGHYSAPPPTRLAPIPTPREVVAGATGASG